MTLESIPEYDRSNAYDRGERAVVIGAGFAGLCAARALIDYYETVSILERDSLDESLEPRRGVPQGQHPHNLRLGGERAIKSFFPTYGDEVVAGGGVEIDIGTDMKTFALGDFWADPATTYTLSSASRPLFERVLRNLVTELDGVRLRTRHQCLEYLTDEQTDVRGVRVRNDDGEVETVRSDLVVDATGRATATPDWLDEHGYGPPPVEEVTVNVAYSSCRVKRPPDDTRAFVVLPGLQGRAALVIPVENDRWFVTLIGRGDDRPPTDPDEFVRYAEGLPTQDVQQILKTHAWVSDDIAEYPFPSNRRYRYDELDRFPEGLAVIGDAIASFNPTYAQGMSVAAMEAVVLHDVLATPDEGDIGRRLVERSEPILDAAWFLAVGFDGLFPETSGPVPDGVDAYREYMTHLGGVIHDDGVVAEGLWRVTELEKPPSSLLRPAIVRRVYGSDTPNRRSDEHPQWVPPSIDDVWPRIDEQLALSNQVQAWPGFSSPPTPVMVDDD